MHDDELTGRTLLVTGGSGFLGRTVLRDLFATFPGRVVSVRRSPRCTDEAPLRPPHQEIHADLRDPGGDERNRAWLDALRDADYVFWMAAHRDHGASAARAIAENVEPLRRAVSVLRGSSRLRRFVFASSISALDQPPFPARPRVLRDDSPAHCRTHYGRSKLECEAILAASGLPATVLRLPFLYGPGFRPGSFLDFYRRVALRPALSALCYPANLSLLHTGDVAGVLLEVLAERNRARADESPYVVSDGVEHEVDDLITLVARLHGRGRPAHRLPVALSRAAGAVALGLGAVANPGPIRRGRTNLLLGYWSHAALTRNYFVVDSRRFRAAFPRHTYTPVEVGMARAFGAWEIGTALPFRCVTTSSSG